MEGKEPRKDLKRKREKQRKQRDLEDNNRFIRKLKKEIERTTTLNRYKNRFYIKRFEGDFDATLYLPSTTNHHINLMGFVKNTPVRDAS